MSLVCFVFLRLLLSYVDAQDLHLFLRKDSYWFGGTFGVALAPGLAVVVLIALLDDHFEVASLPSDAWREEIGARSLANRLTDKFPIFVSHGSIAYFV